MRALTQGLHHAPTLPPILTDAVDGYEAAQALANIFSSIADETCTRKSMKHRAKINFDAIALVMSDLGFLSGVQK